MTAKTVYVHIGPLKTGTSYVQTTLQRNAEKLAADGALYVRGRRVLQVRSVLDLLDRKVSPAGKGNHGHWQALVREVHDWGGDRAIVSQEFLCTATPEQAGRLVSSLAPADVHVIYTARDLSRVLPGAWQTLIRIGRHLTFGEFLASARHPEDGSRREGAHFWRQQHPAHVLSSWQAHVPPERITVVTVPPPGSDPTLLWQRFCAACGLDPKSYDSAGSYTNLSLGAAEVESLRRVNMGLAGRVGRRAYIRWMRRFLIPHVLMERQNPEQLALPPADYPWVSDRSGEMVDLLAAGGYRVIGDLAELLPGPAPGTPVIRPEEMDPGAVLDATVDALVEVLVEARRGHPSGHARGRASQRRAAGRA